MSENISETVKYTYFPSGTVKVAVHPENENGDIITLLEKIEVNWKGRSFTIPANFQCDGCSVPGFLWDSISPRIDPRTLRGAIIHDYIYRGNLPEWSRADADELFLETIRADGFSTVRAYLAYWGVRLGGASSFKGDAA